MPARKEISIKKLGIIAGGGILPVQLAEACKAQGIEPVVVGYRGYTDIIEPDYWARIGSSLKTVNFLKEQNVKDLVFIGAIKRPNIFNLWPDWETFKFFLKAWFNSFGDNSLLSAARQELEERGFKLHGAHEFMPELLMKEGILGIHPPLDGHQVDVQVGIQAARELGKQDKGQAVIIKNGQIIAREDKRGTSAMIKRYGTEGAVLVKMCKPQQDKDMDLPTIGPETAKLCANKNIAGIVGQADNTLLVESHQVREIADQNNLFVLGVTINE